MILSLEVDNIDVVGVMGTLTWRARERVTVDGGLTTGRQEALALVCLVALPTSSRQVNALLAGM